MQARMEEQGGLDIWDYLSLGHDGSCLDWESNFDSTPTLRFHICVCSWDKRF